MLNISIQKRTDIILHFNKMHLQDANIPMWVIKAKGQTYYVNHVDMDSGIGFSTKETPDNPSTKGSLKFKGKLDITDENNTVNARIYG
jgi:hypothetical protein